MKKFIAIAVTALFGCGGPAFTSVDADSGAVVDPPPAVDGAEEAATDAGKPVEVDSGSVDSGTVTADSGTTVEAEAGPPSLCCYVLGTAFVRCDPSAPWSCLESDQSYACTEPGMCTPDVQCTVSGLAQRGVVQACQ